MTFSIHPFLGALRKLWQPLLVGLFLVSPAWGASMDEEALRGFFEARWREAAEDPSPWRGPTGAST